MPTTEMMIEAFVEHRANGGATGVPDYFWQLVERFKAELVNQAFALIGNQSDAEDVAQESMCEAFESLNALKDPAQLGAWMRQINRRNAMDYLRKRRTDEARLRRARKESGRFEGVTGGYALFEIKEVVARAVDSLPAPLREVVVLRHWERLSYKDISALLGVPVGTVKSQIFRADALLEQRLRKFIDDEPACPPGPNVGQACLEE